ncbi:MAG: hypothetical protein H6705_16700 [Myxococcales bacterium]|nr:hypothetical protein [Myxococcales bacterium]
MMKLPLPSVGELAFLRRLLDAARQQATVAELAILIAERAGWSPDEVFALAEELSDRACSFAPIGAEP